MKEMNTETSEFLYVVDIGARGGLHPRWSKYDQEVKAILFEPDPEEYETLKAAFGDNHIILNTALSDAAKEAELYLCKFQPASSLYQPNREILERYYTDIERFDIVDTLKVTTDTLDHQLSRVGLVDIDFIKVD